MRVRTGLLALAAVVLAVSGGACSTRSGGYYRFVHGNVPDYTAAWREANRNPDESLAHFIARVRRLAAQATPVHAPLPSIESSDPVLRDGLAQLLLAPTPANHWLVAEAYRRVGVLDRAHDHMRQAVVLDPRFAPGWDGLARIWRDWGAPEYALADATRAVYFAPEEPAYRNTLGTVLQALGRWSEARTAYEAALSRAPQASWALNNLCALDLTLGRPADAQRRCESALAAAPGLRAARRNLALARAGAETRPPLRPASPSGGAAATGDIQRPDPRP